jgi:hypothetical protein
MNTILRSALLTGALSAALLVGTALAQKQADVPVAGKYESTFSKVSDNCKDTGMSIAKSSIELAEPKKGRVDVTIPMVPFMKGSVRRGGKFKAEIKRGKTGIEGVEGRFSVAGRVDGDKIQFLFIAEYYSGDKPLCTQSWNAAGSRGKR